MRAGRCVSLAVLALSVAAHTAHEYSPEKLEELHQKWEMEWTFSGISTFAHMPYVKCLTDPSSHFDIGIIGAPFDTATNYRPGARFGPRAIRAASTRQTAFRSFNARAGLNPYTSWARILDCGDIPVTPFDNALALRQMTEALTELGTREPESKSVSHTKLLTLGGDHSVALPALRAINAIHGPVAVLHFDAHLDTWHPNKYPSIWESPQSDFNHGSMFWMASNEGLILNGSSVHAGIHTRLFGNDYGDWEDDDQQGFLRILVDDIEEVGTKGIIETILKRIGPSTPVYLSLDIDVIDPGLAPGTGTPEPGGWTTREVIKILRGIESLNVVGADIVEVSPSYDGAGEQTAMAAAHIAFELLSSMVKKGVVDMAPAVKVQDTKGEL